MRKVVLLTAYLSASLPASLPGQWVSGYYSAQNSVEPIAQIPWGKYTQIIHFAAAPAVDSSGHGNGEVALHYLTPSEIRDINTAKKAGTQVLVCIKDNDRYPAAFRDSTRPDKIDLFVNRIAAFANANGYDGVDLDWEANVDVTQYRDLITRLRAALGSRTLTIAAGDWNGLDRVAAAAQPSLDQINIMCYDMDNGHDCQGSDCTWHNDALLQSGDLDRRTCDNRVRAFTSRGVARGKIGIGIPFYGRRHFGVQDPGVLGSFRMETVPYRALVSDAARWQSQFQHYDDVHKADYLSLPPFNEFISFTGLRAIRDIVTWRRQEGFGGVMTFPIESEFLPGREGDAQYPLSTAIALDLRPAPSRSRASPKR